MAALPPGVTAESFAATIKQFQAAIGVDWVMTGDEELFPYRDPFSLLHDLPNELLPGAAVGPDASPNLRGSVVLDLKRMNRVLEIDEERHFALVEPGVSYIDLYRHIQDRGLKLWVDTPDPGWGSPIGNSLDHGIGYTMGPYRDQFGASCGVEVVLPNGELMCTGMGALPGSQC
jgi:4-cresol dehydrogenase (hydroxylating)